MISVTGLCKDYGSRRVLSDVTFSCAKGEILALLGLNGAGKSTILKILCGLVQPSAGSVSLKGRILDPSDPERRRLIGFQPDSAPIYPEMRVHSFLEYLARLRGIPKSEAATRAAGAMERVGLRDVRNQRLRELSHGYRQRLGIAQALAHSPEILILDEPINGLDPVQIKEMRDLVNALRGDFTVLISSHILSEVTRTCDRILILDAGRVVAEGTEAALEKRLMGEMRLEATLDSFNAALELMLRGIPGVRALEIHARTGSDPSQLVTLLTSGDVRREISSAIVHSGTGLLGLRRVQAGLEGVFLGLVQGNNLDAAAPSPVLDPAPAAPEASA